MAALLMLAAALHLAAAPAPAAATAATAAQLRAGLVGQWTGALGYRDYQSDRLFELPLRTTITAVPDGATLVRTSAFDDGPKAGTVWITTVELDDAKAGTVASASFRKGRKGELSTETVRVASFTDATHWTLIYSETGADDDKPAELRITETRDGSSLRSVKEVRPIGAPETAWRQRNQSRLTLAPSP